MISSDTRIKLKRSGVAGRIPTLADLQLGELGINYNDGKIFLRQENETVGSRIIQPGQADVVGKTIFVTVEGNDNNSGLNERDAVRTIKKAAELAEYGDGIKVYPGHYIEDNPIEFRDLVAVEGMDLRNVLVTPANPEEDLYLVGDGFHATNHSFVSNKDSKNGAAIISFRRLEGTASDRYFDAARLIRDNLEFISGEAVGFLTSGYSGFAGGQRSQDGARALELNTDFISEEAFQYINSPDYTGPEYVNPDINQCRSDLKDILGGWQYDLISDGNSETTGVGLTYYAPIPFVKSAQITDLVYDNQSGLTVIETDISTQLSAGDQIKLDDIKLDCPAYGNANLITDFKYDNVSGVGTVTLPFFHNINIGDTIKLDDLKFDCPPYGAQAYGISNFVYEETTGESIITLDGVHNLTPGDSIEIRNVQFDCPAYGAQFTNVVNLEYDQTTGRGVLTYEDALDLSAGDTIQLFDLNLDCPPYGNAISIDEFIYDNLTGQSQITLGSPHGLQPGDLVKLDGAKFNCDSYLDETFGITGFNYNNLTGESIVTLNKNHSYVTGDSVDLDGLVFQCNSYLPDALDVTSFTYENASGLSVIALSSEHSLVAGDRFRLDNLVFSCNSYSFTDIAVQDADYDNVTGFVTLELGVNHGQTVGERVRLADLEYSCVNSGITTNLFPDGTFGYEFEILSVPTPSKMIVNVGTSTIEHSYVGGGTATVGITTTVFPDGTQGYDFIVDRVIDNQTIETSVGISTIAHTYVGSGKLFVGFTTTVFPDGTQGNTFTVENVPAQNQVVLNVGTSDIIHNYVGGGSLSSDDNFIGVNGLVYDNVSGEGVVSLAADHDLVVGDSFILQDVKFSCDSYRSNSAANFAVSGFDYDNQSGISTITLSDIHNVQVGDSIALYDIEFTCTNSGITTTIFPDGSVDNFYPVLATPNPNTIVTRVGTSDIVHTYVQGGTVQSGITTNIFPDGTRPSGDFFQVTEVVSSTSVRTKIGVSSIAHVYADGGKFYTGITTNIFPQTFEDPNVRVESATYNNVNGEVLIETNKPHGVAQGSSVLLQGLEFACTSGGPNNTPGALVFPRNQEVYTASLVSTPTSFVVNVGTSAFTHTYLGGGICTPENIRAAIYNKAKGELTVTTTLQHGYSAGDKASVVDLLFSCNSGGEGNAPGTLLFPRPTDEFVVTAVGTNQFTVNVGAFPSLAHTYVNGGSVRFQSTTLPIATATYDQLTGDLVVVTASDLGVSVDSLIVMQGLVFSCTSGGLNNDPGTIIFPRLDVPVYDVVAAIDEVTYVIKVGTSTLAHTYVSGGFSSLKKKVNSQNIFRVEGTPTPNTIVTRIGTNPIAHEYVGGGNALVGITTTVFPDGTRTDGYDFTILSALTPNSIAIDIGTSTIPHNYESGGRMQYGETNERRVIDFVYDNITGKSTVTVQGTHGLSVGNSVKLDGLEFACTNSPGITTTIFPDGTASSYNIYPVTEVINNNTFVTNVGRVAFEHTYQSGGSAFVGVTTNIFPDGTQGYDYTVDRVISPTEVTVNVGMSSITHEYIRGGTLFAGRSNERDILDFEYNHVSGDAILTFRKAENLQTGDLVKLADLRFDCPNSTGITTSIFPDGTIGNLFPVLNRLNPTQYKLKIAPSPFAHNYVRGTGAAFVGITTNIFPDLTTQPTKLFEVVGIPAPNQVAAKVGVSTIPHVYEGGGRLFTGINTDTFPGNSEVSPLGDTYTIQSVTPEGELVVNVGVSSIPHNYIQGWSNGRVKFGQSAGGELQHIAGPGVKDATIAAIDFEREAAGYAINNRPFGSFIVAETGKVESIEYNNVSGFATVTSRNINVQVGDLVRMSDIQFRCSDEYAGLTTTFFPDNTRQEGQYFTVENRLDENSFETFIGISSIAHNYNKGGNVYRYRQTVLGVDYTNVTGVTSIRSISHGFNVGDTVQLGDIEFDCPVFTPDYNIENFQYDNFTGLSTVTTVLDNDIEVGDLVKLADIKLQCPSYGNEILIDGFQYDNISGLSTITTLTPHGVSLNERTPIGIQTASYDNVSGELEVTTVIDINLNGRLEEGVVLAGLAFTCPGGSGITTTIFPEEGYVYKISEIESPNKFTINVGASAIEHDYIGGGTVTEVLRTDIKLANIKFDCPPYGNEIQITNFLYDNTTGNSLVTLAGAHSLTLDETIKLRDIKFQCPPYNNDFSVIDAQYTNTTGILTVTTSESLGNLNLTDKIRLQGAQFDCESGVTYDVDNVFWSQGNETLRLRINTNPNLQIGDPIKLQGLFYRIPTDPAGTYPRAYPDGRDPSLNIYPVSFVGPDGPQFRVEVILPLLNEAGVEFEQNSTNELITGITTNIYPDTANAEGGIYDILSLPANNQVTIQVGLNSIPHTYIRNGTVFTGVTTNFFPGSLQNSPKGDLFPVLGIPTPNQIRINVGVSSISHVYDSGGQVLTGITTNIFPSSDPINSPNGDIFPVLDVIDNTTLLVNVGASTIPHTYNSGGEVLTGITTNIFPGNRRNSPKGNIFKVIAKDMMCPDRFEINVGVSSIAHNYVEGGTVTTGVTTNRFPDGTNGDIFEITRVLNADYFDVNVGPSSIAHNYIDGGFVRKYESPITNYVYNNVTGLSAVTSLNHRLNVGDLVKLRDIRFDCDSYGGENAITGVTYNNIIGTLAVTTQEPHGLFPTEPVKLAGIQMDCAAYGNEIGIINGLYDNDAGTLQLQLSQPHGLGLNDNMKLAGLEFDCPGGSGITTNVFPDGTAASFNIFPVDSIDGASILTLQVGVSSINHTYRSGTGSAFVGVTTNIFPGSSQNSPKGSILPVVDVTSTNTFIVNVGVSTITHSYIRGGVVQVGVTTDIFPDGTQGDFFTVEDVLTEDAFLINSGISSIIHRYNSGGFMSKYSTYQSTKPQVIDTSVIRVSGDCMAVVDRVDQLARIVTSILDNGPAAAPGAVPVNVTGASYTNTNGNLLVTVDSAVSLSVNDIVKVRNLIFSCQKTAEVAFAAYDNRTGKTTIRTTVPHGAVENELVTLEGLEFACNKGTEVYPSAGTGALRVTKLVDLFTYEIQLETSSDVHTYISGGVSTTVPTQRVFPDNKQFLYRVTAVNSNNSFTINVGANTIPHTYVSGGVVSPGQRFSVVSSDFDSRTGELLVTTDRPNYFVADTGVQLNNLKFACASGGPNNAPGTLSFPDDRAANVVSSTYDNVTGVLRVTTNKPHQAYRDVKVTLEGLEFSCNLGSKVYPTTPREFRVTKVVDRFTYEVQLETSTRAHTYISGGTSDVGPGNYRISRLVNETTFAVQMAPNPIEHTYVGGGTAASVFTQQILTGINLRTAKCAEDIGKVYLAVVHDITRGGNSKSVTAARKYYDAVGQYQHIAGGEVNQTVAALEYSLKVVRCVINNVSWGGVPRGYFTGRERAFIPTAANPNLSPRNAALSRDLLRLVDMPPQTSLSVVGVQRAYEQGQYTTTKKSIEAFDYNNITGIASVTTTQAHRLIKYDAIELSDIQMRCVGSPRLTTNIFPDGTQGDVFEVKTTIQDNEIFGVSGAQYDETTGTLVIESAGSVIDISKGSLINLRYLRWNCNSAGVPGSKLYPTNPDFVYEVKDRPTADSLVVNVGVSTIAHTFLPISTGVNVPQFQELPKKFEVHVGTVPFPHIYESGGTVWKQEPFLRPSDGTQLRDASIQDDPIQLTNSTPNACANVFSAIENTVGIVTTIIDVGFEASGISYRYPGNDGKGVDTIEEMSSQGVGNIIKGPYIRNCTNFVPKSIGMRMDGFDAEPGDEIPNGVQGSSNVDSFTQFNPGGIGCSISNGTYQQLVSIFTICCDEAIVCDSGAQLDLTNSNSSFGRLGLVARGIGDAKSKCIDRYTGIVAEEAQIEDDVVIIRGVGNKRPYDGQGIFFGELYREVTKIIVTDPGSGYSDDNPPNARVAVPEGPSGIKAEVSPTVRDGKVVSIEIISNGNQYLETSPKVTIDPPKDPSGRQADAIAVTEPLYYDVDSSSAPEEGTVRVVFKQRLNNTVSVGTTVFFSRLSLQIASSHSFEYIGSGNEINGARPSQGGVPIKENEVVKEEGGSIVYTSTDQAGNFNIGDDFVINQFTGTVTGRSFDQSVLNKVTPLIIALDS